MRARKMSTPTTTATAMSICFWVLRVRRRPFGVFLLVVVFLVRDLLVLVLLVRGLLVLFLLVLALLVGAMVAS